MVHAVTAVAILITVVSLAASLSLAGLLYKSSVPTVNIGQQTSTVYEFDPLIYPPQGPTLRDNTVLNILGRWLIRAVQCCLNEASYRVSRKSEEASCCC